MGDQEELPVIVPLRSRQGGLGERVNETDLCLRYAMGEESALEIAELDGGGLPARGGGQGGRRGPFGPRGQFALVFGYDPSVSRDEIAGSIPQALAMMNHPQIQRHIRARDSGTMLGRLLAHEKTIDKGELCRRALERIDVVCEPSPALLIDNKTSNLDAWAKHGGIGYLYTSDGRFRQDVAGGIDGLVGR